MSSENTAQLAESLYQAERHAVARTPLTDLHPELTPEHAYAIQDAYAAMRRADGAVLVGRKIGATSQAIQDLFDVRTPDFGQLFDDMQVTDGGTLRCTEMIAPMVEPELDFVLKADLGGPGVTRDDVLEATERVLPCLEIIDSRIERWQIQYADTVADNGSSARFVVGTDGSLPPETWPRLDEVSGRLFRDGQLTGQATGAAVLGHPADAVAWLANVLGDLGAGLLAGQHVLSGSFIAAVPALPGQQFRAEFDDFGSVSVRFE